MEEWIKKGRELSELIRPSSFPLAVKLIKNEEDIPQNSRRPLKDFKTKIAICQGITMSRKYGWTVAMSAEDVGCAPARFAYGWGRPEDEEKIANFWYEMGYAKDLEVGAKITERIYRLNPGEYSGIVLSPLEKTRVIPDLIMIYGNSAQMMRLVHGGTHHHGDPVASIFSGKSWRRKLSKSDTRQGVFALFD